MKNEHPSLQTPKRHVSRELLAILAAATLWGLIGPVTVWANRAGLTVTLDGSTAYKSLARAEGRAALTNAAQADVKVGSHLIVEGIASPDGKTLIAKAVILLPNAKPARPARP